MTTTPSLEGRCPYIAAHTIPHDGTPLHPSPALAALRDEAPASRLRFADGHIGWIVLRHDLARDVLADPRFSMQPGRLPLSTGWGSHAGIDDDAARSQRMANLLSLDAPQHSRIRRAVTKRFAVRAARTYQPWVGEVVREQVEHLKEHGSPVDLTEEFAEPISVRNHCHILGVPGSHVARFAELFVKAAPRQERFDFIREVFALKREAPGDDVISDLIAGELSTNEAEGITFVLMTSGRDSVAYMIATATVALLTQPQEARALRDDPALITTAVEEFMRYGAMFVTLFPRTALEDVELDGVTIRRGETVSVSPVSANRDERQFERPDEFDITRDAGGHLGFGHGQHGCIGQQVARLEIREAVTQLLAAFPTLSLVSAEQTDPLPFASDVPTYRAGSVTIAW